MKISRVFFIVFSGLILLPGAGLATAPTPATPTAPATPSTTGNQSSGTKQAAQTNGNPANGSSAPALNQQASPAKALLSPKPGNVHSLTTPPPAVIQPAGALVKLIRNRGPSPAVISGTVKPKTSLAAISGTGLNHKP